MMNRLSSLVRIIGVVTLVLIPSAAFAQGSIAGAVKDTSGALLPGVTVEVASPVLIEKTRSVVTDGSGLYQVVDLRPGTYVVTFTLAGFNTVKREGIELTGSFTATVNIEMKVGAVEETITVTGEAPVVNIQGATAQRVMNSTVIGEIPSGRSVIMAVLVPGVSQPVGTAPDVGGTAGSGTATDLVAHGSQGDSMRIMQNGLPMAALGDRSSSPANTAAMQEMAVDFGAVDASVATGGVRVNFIPRDGGNTLKGSGFAGFANASMQGNNFTQRLKDLGFAAANSIERLWDVNPGIGGPIAKDKLWFYTTARHLGAYNYVGGLFYNANAGNPNAWTYAPDTSRQAENNSIWTDIQARLTWQATPTNKFAFSTDFPDSGGNPPFGCVCPKASSTLSVEANQRNRFRDGHFIQLDWSSPATSRLLLEGAINQRVEKGDPDNTWLNPQLVSVTEQGGAIPGLTYRAPATTTKSLANTLFYRGAVSYIPGAHAFKVGFSGGRTSGWSSVYSLVPYSYRFNNGVPNLLTLQATPYTIYSAAQYDIGIYAQDKWTRGRLTASYGLRFDYFGNTIPENHLGPGPLAPTRDVTFPAQPNLGWKDLSPKLSAVYDLFGTGKTALKVSLNRYLQFQSSTSQGSSSSQLASSAGPASNLVTSTTRSWADANKNFIPDCDLTNPQANGECGKDANTNFGNSVPGASFDPKLLGGWFHRNYNWEFSVGVQHEILPRVSVDVSYFRRWFGNFQVADNLNVAPSDYTAFSVTSPTNAGLPNGGGSVVSGLFDLNPSKFGQPTNLYNTLSDNYGNQISHWNGVDLSVNTRLAGGLVLQGGISTGRTLTDNCEIVAKLPELLITGSTVLPASYCHQDSGFVTQGKFIGAYTIPKIALLVSGTLQSIPGPPLAANFIASNALVAPSLGRNLSAGSTTNVTVNLIPPGTLYGGRYNQLDFRVAKSLRFGKTRATAGVDVYNALNVDTVLTENSSYAAWRQPLTIIPARFAKVSLQWDF